MIGLIGYYKKFFPLLSDMIQALNKLTRKNVPFKWAEQCQKSLEYVKQIIIPSKKLAYLDPTNSIIFSLTEGNMSKVESSFSM